MSEPTDANLVQAARTGEPQSFCVLV